jgi:small redox-active disulfide protein 2
MKILILGPGCTKCKLLFDHASQAVKELGVEAEIEKIEDIQQIVALGILSTPGIVIDGRVKGSGRVFSVDDIKKMISEKGD